MTSGKRRTGFWNRLIEAIATWENAMDYTPYDYALDRVSNLEREVTLLRDELRMVAAVGRAGGQTEPVSSSPVEAVR
jgi:hypothetical protein